MAKKNQMTTSDPLTYDEYQKFLNCLRKDKEYMWEMYARLSFCTACRVSDVVRLRWEDVLNKSAIVITEQKTGKTRRIPFNPSVQKKFAELYVLMDRPDKKDLILSGKWKDREITVQSINQHLKLFKDKYSLNINHFSTHTFRKTFGRYVYDCSNHSAESLVLLNKILNHSNIQTTRVYLGIVQDEIDGIFNSINF